MAKILSQSYRMYHCASCKQLNGSIYSQFLSERDQPAAVKSHFFEGRFENIYIPLDRMPTLGLILDQAKAIAAEEMGRSVHQLKIGFWFNAMRPGDVTLPHCHDNDDELLSAVYYIRTPMNSGALHLQASNGVSEEIQPEEGSFVFFPPMVMHHVNKNESDALRLSLGMNIGPRE